MSDFDGTPGPYWIAWRNHVGSCEACLEVELCEICSQIGSDTPPYLDSSPNCPLKHDYCQGSRQIHKIYMESDEDV